MLPSHFSVVDLGVFALAIVVGLLVLLFYLFDFSSNKGSSLPGVPPRDPVKGNLEDIGEAGSLHQFLLKLHKDYGPLACFWWGELQVVSIAAPSLWRQIQGLFDRPVPLFKMFEPLITKHSIQFANGTDARKRHKLLTSGFGHGAMSRFYDIFTKIGEDKVKEWESFSPEDHILLQDASFNMAAQSILLSAVGPVFHGTKEAHELIEAYHTCFDELEDRLSGEPPEEGSERDVKFKEGVKKIEALLKQVISERRKNKPDEDEKNIIDRMIEEDYPEHVLYADVLATLIGGLHTSALLITWSIYFMSKHPEVQERVYEELKDVLGEETVTPEVLGQLKYLRQVLDETLRCATIAPYAARYSDFDAQVGEHKIPKETPMLIALGVVHQDPEIWSEPQRFDPDRFNPEEMKLKEPLTFEPFGFAGKRKCPGYRFSYTEVTIMLSILIRRFEFHLAEDQEIHYVHGLVTKPDKDIYITVSKRK